MAGDTDRLVNFCREASSLYDPREYDGVVSSGEQITSGLLAIALQALGVKFNQDPLNMGPVTTAVLDDTCGNLIQLVTRH